VLSHDESLCLCPIPRGACFHAARSNCAVGLPRGCSEADCSGNHGTILRAPRALPPQLEARGPATQGYSDGLRGRALGSARRQDCKAAQRAFGGALGAQPPRQPSTASMRARTGRSRGAVSGSGAPRPRRASFGGDHSVDGASAPGDGVQDGCGRLMAVGSQTTVRARSQIIRVSTWSSSSWMVANSRSRSMRRSTNSLG
jgi:hypothetical protein